MAISDRIAVMKDGVIQHIGKPKDLYQRPANLFVATFHRQDQCGGSGAPCRGRKRYGPFPVDSRSKWINVRDEFKKNQKVIASVRPENSSYPPNPNEGIETVVDSNVFLGLNTHYSSISISASGWRSSRNQKSTRA